MKSLLRPMLLLLAFASPAFAHADTVSTFYLNATVFNGTVTGTIGIDVTSGVFVSEDITAATTAGTITYDVPSLPSYDTSYGYTDQALGNFSGDDEIDINVSTLIGYSGGNLCTLASMCPDNNASNFDESSGVTNLVTGTLTPYMPLSSPTPEPGSLALLSTGVLGIARVVRRRRFKRS